MVTETIFFDGVCGLCNRFVDWIIRRDHRGRYCFAPLQGTTAQRLGVQPQTQDAAGWTIILVTEGRPLERSDAVLTILAGLGGFYRLAGSLRYVPRPLRDWVYTIIARKRYRIFGKLESCRMPEEADRDRFLP